MTARTPANVKLWRANYTARKEARDEADRQAIRERFADYEPKDVRTYGVSASGIDYDAAIRAAAESSVPRPESPNKGSVKR